MGRLESHNAAGGRRDADGATDVRAGCKRCEACGQGGTGATGRAARTIIQPPGISRVAPNPGVGDARQAELRRGGAAKNDGAGFFEALDHGIGKTVDSVFKNERAMGGALVFYVLGVFDEQGNAFKGTGFGAALSVDLFSGSGLGKGFIKVAVGEAVDLRVHFLNAVNQCGEQFDRRRFTGFEKFQGIHG